jgi:integrase
VTLNSEITMIRAFLYWCVEFKSLPDNPAAKIKPRQVLQKPPTVYSDEELTLLLKHSNEIEGALLLTCCYTGMREQEICFLTWSDVDLRKKILRVTAKPEYGFTPKTWEERDIEMSDRLVEAFKKLPRHHPWVFPTTRGKRHAHIYKIVERVAERAGIKNAHPHKFRSTFLTRLLQSAATLRTSRRWLGTRISKQHSVILESRPSFAGRP